VLVTRGGFHAAPLALAVRFATQPATFASQACEPQNAKVPSVFRTDFVRKPREIKAQTRRHQRPKERLLRPINGAPRRRTQKQNSPSEPGRPDPGVQPTTAKTTKTLPTTNCRLRRKSQPQRRNQLPTPVAKNAQGDRSHASQGSKALASRWLEANLKLCRPATICRRNN